jgi:hypothetical protein
MAGGLNDILTQVNAPVQALLYGGNSFSGFEVYGIATSAWRNGKPATELYPVVYTKGGEGVYVGIQEKPVIIYHRCNSLTAETGTTRYGDGSLIRTNRYNMNMIVFVDRNKTGLEADELFLLLQSVFPESVAVEPYMKVTTNIKNVILNTQQVFRNEYQGVTYFVKPEHALFQVDYTIESTLKPGCFNIAYYA